MTIVFTARPGTAVLHTPGTWWWGDGPGSVVWFRCSQGHLGVLADHTIHPDGRVEPSVQCHIGTCTFHDEVMLSSYP